MTVLHLLCVIYLVASAMVWLEVFSGPDRTANGPHVLAWFVFALVIPIYALTV